VWAFSGGGPLLAWLVRERPPFVRCLLAFYSMLDLRHLVEPGHAEQAERATRVSPAAHLADGHAVPPTFVARAGRDTPIVNASVDAFVRAALAGNAPLTLVNHPHGQHAFDVLDDVALSRDIIDQAMRFARQHLALVLPLSS
jgi:dienelactone hydrolase